MLDDLQSVDLDQYPRIRTVDYLSPFRYPGGKSFLTGYLASIAKQLPTTRDTHYLEPYCGGAGAALGLLAQNAVSKIHLNDRDIRVYSAWKAIIDETQRFIETLDSVPVTIETWRKCRDLVEASSEKYSFELGFATFFINRTSRAGIVLGSGPIGGYKQQGHWKIDARYYGQTIKKRLNWIGQHSNRIELSNDDGIDFLNRKSKELENLSTLYFIDPPYVKAGGRLYLNTMTDSEHRKLSDILKTNKCRNWILTYDDHPLIRELYQDRRMRKLHVNYSLRKTRKEAELIVDAL